MGRGLTAASCANTSVASTASFRAKWPVDIGPDLWENDGSSLICDLGFFRSSCFERNNRTPFVESPGNCDGSIAERVATNGVFLLSSDAVESEYPGFDCGESVMTIGLASDPSRLLLVRVLADLRSGISTPANNISFSFPLEDMIIIHILNFTTLLH